MGESDRLLPSLVRVVSAPTSGGEGGFEGGGEERQPEAAGAEEEEQTEWRLSPHACPSGRCVLGS